MKISKQEIRKIVTEELEKSFNEENVIKNKQLIEHLKNMEAIMVVMQQYIKKYGNVEKIVKLHLFQDMERKMKELESFLQKVAFNDDEEEIKL
jgi:hypothetical protein